MLPDNNFSGVQNANVEQGLLAIAEAITLYRTTSNAWDSWVPVWTNMAVTNSTVTAKYKRVGNTVNFRILVTLAGGDKPSGSVTFSLPIPAHANYATDGTIMAIVSMLDTGTANYVGHVKTTNATTGIVLVDVTSGTYNNLGAISATIPHTWANTDVIAITGVYECSA